MRYFLKKHVTDEMLEAKGFIKDALNSDESTTWLDRDCLDNPHDKDDVLVVATSGCKYESLKRRLCFNYTSRTEDVGIYIKDLIDLGYVKVKKWQRQESVKTKSN